MKKNGNNIRTSDYYIGLDVGTESVGWAVTDPEYNILKLKGKAAWGVHLFEEANTAADRRTNRTARRRLNRRKQRLALLELLFEEEISKKDPLFFRRLKDSSLHLEDKSNKECKYSLFNDEDFTDKDYLRKYKTIYHLRRELVHDTSAHDVRLVFLALHHILKKRGHFLYEMETGEAIYKTQDLIEELKIHVDSEYSMDFSPCNIDEFVEILQNPNMNITEKKSSLKDAYGDVESNEVFNTQSAINALAGATIKLADLFCDEELKDAEIKSICLKNDLDEIFDQLNAVLGEKIDTILIMKKVYDNARLSQILGNYSFISDAKVNLYEKNNEDLKRLKEFVRKYANDKYRKIFVEKKEKQNNYAAYSRYKTKSGEKSCTQDDFCVFLKKELPMLFTVDEYRDISASIEAKTFLPRLSSTDNGLIPNQLQRMELVQILKNAEKYLTFLTVKDADGLTISEKIISIFDFKIPYYVGPLNMNASNRWVVRTGDKIYPWNFEKVVNTEESAERFIKNLIGRCTYTGEDVLPKDSLLYSEYMVLNEINTITVNGVPIDVETKKKIYQDLFVDSSRKVTKKGIKVYLEKEGIISSSDEIAGVDDSIKSKLKSYHDLKEIISKLNNDIEMVEEIISRILIFSDDKKMLRKWLKKNIPMLDEADYNYICRLKYKDWGSLSREFLTKIESPDENGEVQTIISMLRNTNNNLMKLLSNNYLFLRESENYRKEKFGITTNLDSMMDEMYISPSVRRSIRQTLKIVDEIVDIQKSAPKKIFIEVARGADEKQKGQRTKSRKDALIELYKVCKEQKNELFDRLVGEEENRLRSDKLFLYYSQFGKCMYSGEPIDIQSLNDENSYDIDHIFPQSRIKDDSLDNRVLVKAELNRIKTNIYPLPEEWRKRMKSFWKMLNSKKMISDKKYQRLVRVSPLTVDELSSFINRQLVETQQSTKALAHLMSVYYPNSKTVYSKARNVSEFRQKNDFTKCRDVNDLHHAKDAYLNIVVGNVYATRFTDRFFKNIENENYSLNKVFAFNVQGAWDKEKSLLTVRKYMEKNNILFTRTPHEAKGQLYDLQILPAGKGQLPVKQGLDIDKYGGYNNVSGAYFCVVEHQEKKKRIRSIEPVYIYKKAFYEANPEKYCEDVLGLIEPKIIVKKVYFDSLFELDKKKMNITGRTGRQIVFKHVYQLALEKEVEEYIKKISKYIARCDEKKKELEISEHDGIKGDENIKLYKYFMDKLNMPVYNRLFNNMLNDMIANEEKFNRMSLYEQCRLLLQILKAFKCDRQCPDFSTLCGKKTVGTVLYSKIISKVEEAFVINQSVTGIYETKIDLLK